MSPLHYVAPGPVALCGFKLRRKDHESLRETVARTTDEVTCPACLDTLDVAASLGVHPFKYAHMRRRLL